MAATRSFSDCQRGVVPDESRARRPGAGEPSSSLAFRFRFLLSPRPMSSVSFRRRVVRLPCVPPGLAGFVMLNWLGWKSSADESETSSASFSLLRRFFFAASELIRRSLRVEVRAWCSRRAVSSL